MPIFNVNNKKTSYSLNSDEFVNFITGGEQANYISATTALKNSDVFSLIMQLSGDLAKVKYKVAAPLTQSLLRNPSLTSNGISFWQSMFAQLLLDGNAYAYRWKNINGVDVSWEYLRPSQVNTMLLEDGSGLVYDVNFDEPDVDTMLNVPSSDMIHFRLLSQNGGKTGISPLSALVNELKIKDSSNDLTLKALKQSITANGVLAIEHGGLLDDKAKAKHSRKVKAQLDNSDGGPLVIDNLETYTPLEVKSNVAQLLAQTDWTSKQIAKVYGIPDSYLNGTGDQQSSVTQIGGQYAKSLNRFVQPIVSELDDKLNADVTASIRNVIDPLGEQLASTISNLTKSGILASNQAQFVLQNAGYLPDDMPKADKPPAPIISKGGDDKDDEDNSSQGNSDSK